MNPSEATKYLQTVQSTQQYQKFKEDVLHLQSEIHIQENNAAVYSVNGETIVARIPVAGQIEGGFYSVIFDGISIAISTTLTGLLIPVNNEDIHVIGSKDGKIVVDQVVSESEVSPAIDLDCLDECLSSKGIAGYLITLAFGICSVICSCCGVSACAACLVAAFGGYGAVAAYCTAACS